MSGLLTKDVCLVLQRKQGMVLFLAIAVLMSFTMEGSFTFGYTMFFLMILAVSTISYDEFDNGYCFLMTLPITRKIYVVEKYVFCALTACVGWFFSALICIVVGMFRQVEMITMDTIVSMIVMLPVVLTLMAIMIPIQLKYGSEKSRVVLIAVMGVGGMILLGMGKMMHALGMPMDDVFQKMKSVSDEQLLGVFFIIAIACCAISGIVSLHIMNGKEF